MKKFTLLFRSIWLIEYGYSQTTEEEPIKVIRSEFQEISANLGNYTKKVVEWLPGDPSNYWLRREYTGYLNQAHQLVMLPFPAGEEGYWDDTAYYFRNAQICFIYIQSGDPDGNEKQERIYFWKNKIIRALVKEKPADNNKDFAELENNRHEEIMGNGEVSSINWLESVNSDVRAFYEALEKQP